MTLPSATMKAAAIAGPLLMVATFTFVRANAVSGAPPARAHPASLPRGAARGYPFGSAMVDGSRHSLLPPNAYWVDQNRVVAAPKAGSWQVPLSRGYAGWPDACRLTNQSQLKKLVPGVTGLHAPPSGTKGVIAGQGRLTPHDTRCIFTLATTFEPPGYSTYSNVGVQLFQVSTGAPSQWAMDLTAQKAEAKKYPTQYAFYPNLPGGAQCFDDGSELRCLQGLVYYWVSGEKVTGGAFFSSDQAVWVEQAELPLAETLATELSTRP